MLDLMPSRTPQACASATMLRLATDRGIAMRPYRGPERRSAVSPEVALLRQILDEMDYGMVLLGDRGQVLHVNHAARTELDGDHPLQLVGRELRARQAQDGGRLNDALVGAARGLRKLFTLGEAAQRVSISVVPLASGGENGAPAVLLWLGKRQVCERLSVQWFARSHSLTPTETRVLEALCEGKDPREVAESHGVGLATVRTQIGSIRAKTGAESIRDLVRRIAVLPPMVSSLRMAA